MIPYIISYLKRILLMDYTETKDTDLVRAFAVRCQKGVFEYP